MNFNLDERSREVASRLDRGEGLGGPTARPLTTAQPSDDAPRNSFQEIVLSLPGTADAGLPIAASRAGALGLLDLTYLDNSTLAWANVARLRRLAGGAYGLVLHGRLGPWEREALAQVGECSAILLWNEAGEDLAPVIASCRQMARRVGLVVTGDGDAERGQELGIDFLVAKGHESGGRTGDETTFVLLQRLLKNTELPVYAWGGVGWNTAAACRVAGATGIVLDWQLGLLRESPLGDAQRKRLASMEGSETIALRGPHEQVFRLGNDAGSAARKNLQATADRLYDEQYAQPERWEATIRQQLQAHAEPERLWPVGQDGALARDWLRHGTSVGRVLANLRRHVQELQERVLHARTLRSGSPLALSHGTEFPIVQGPMTRVSDVPEFAAAVAGAGGLPCLSLALLEPQACRKLLEGTRQLLGSRAWGVGILGFAAAELRAAQQAVIEEVRPPYCVIAGGRADQAAALEARGIHTYLYTASPTSLRSFLEEGARRFIFEGGECGGHVGPRSSFVLWEQMIGTLLEAKLSHEEAAKVHVLFAGGIHDAASGAMVSALAQPLVDRGTKVGVLLGTAYLFTQEAVACGAIVPGFQQAALQTERTVLLESGPGRVTRCADTAFSRTFLAERDRLKREGAGEEETRDALERFNLGRLRIASKGMARREAANGESHLVPVTEQEQRAQGLYMIGQVAALRANVCSIRELHDDVCGGTVRQLEALARRPVIEIEPTVPAPASLDIAIVGMACLLPGATDVDRYWENILQQRDQVGEVPADRFLAERWFDQDRAARDRIYSKWGGFLADVPFDPLKYGIPPAVIKSIEPMQLLALELVDRALRDAGYHEHNPHKERTSVMLGAGGGMAELGANYALRATLPMFVDQIDESVWSQLPEWTEDSFAGILLNVVSGRVSNRFDLGGANFTVDAACASSLAALYLACRELSEGTSDMVIAGGCDTQQNPFSYLCFSKSGALSPTGRSKTFDTQADGIAISEGLAAVILKRRVDAERDGDRIYAVIRAVAGASDGRSKGLTAPRKEGQMRTLERAYAQARFSPATVGLFEAHGTGTAVGDQTECLGLRAVLERFDAAPHSCAIGSVKSLIGHTKCTAGVAGLIKAALALYHRVLPPTLHVSLPNPKAGFGDGPLYVNSETRPWIRGEHPRRAGVSSFGFGGTNFHAVLEEYEGDPCTQRVVAPRRQRSAELFVFAGRTLSELADQARELAQQVDALRQSGAEVSLADVAFAWHTRSLAPDAPERTAVVVRDIDQLLTVLSALVGYLASGAQGARPAGVHFARTPLARGKKLAFLFPGQGSQSPNMLRDVAIEFSEAGERFDRADQVLAKRFERPLSHYIFPPPEFTEEEKSRHRRELKMTDIAQPALGAADLAALRLLESFGVRGDLMAGHSYGELVALCAAGALDEASLYRLSAARGRAIVDMCREGQATELGQMLAVRASEVEVAHALEDCPDVWLANLNSPRQTVISGTEKGIREAQSLLEAKRLACTPLAVSCAFHSPLMEPARRRFAEVLRATEFQPAQTAVYMNATATPYAADASAMRNALDGHLVQQVRFADEVEALLAAGATVFVEVGPGRVLSRLVNDVAGERPHVAIPMQSGEGDGLIAWLSGLAELIAQGVPVNLARLYRGRVREAVDLAALARQPAKGLSRHQWLVNGGYARPAHEPPRQTAPLAQLAGAGTLVARPAPIAESAGKVASSQPIASLSKTAGPAPRQDSGSRQPIIPTVTSPSTGAVVPVAQIPIVPAVQVPRAQIIPVTIPQSPERMVAPGRPTVDKAVASGTKPAPAAPISTPSSRVTPPAMSNPSLPSRAETTAPSPVPSADPGSAAANGTDAHSASWQDNGLTDAAAAMSQFQWTMRRFLETQEAVLSAYFGAGQGTAPTISPQLAPQMAPRVMPAAKGDLSSPPTPAAAPPAPERMAPARTVAPTPAPQQTPASRAVAGPSTLAPTLSATSPMTTAAAVLQSPAAKPAPALHSAERLNALLLEVVSERTGYPSEMLALDAALEADLGIDSIKRVEIIGAFRKVAVPGMEEPPAWFMEQMSSAGTLRQILEGVAQLSPNAAEAISSEAPTHATPMPVASRAGSPPAEGRDLEAMLLGIVAERTGYPPEMLALDSVLEADLGIDSIKRVEIIGAFRKAAVPAMDEPPAWFMEQMSSAGTLRQILSGVQALGGAAGSAPSTVPPTIAGPAPQVAAGADDRLASRSAFESLLVSVVSERTGYPAEMLELDSNLEADLGIDSIKRVEIIGAFRKAAVPAMDEPPAWFMEQMGSAATLRQILDGVCRLTGEDPAAPPLASPALPREVAPLAANATGAPAVAPAPSHGSPSAVAQPAELEHLLLNVVADRTGYPTEMLELDSNLEADLGIDSIKRVEIIGAFRKSALPALEEPPAWFMEQMSGATSLRQILEGVAGLFSTSPDSSLVVELRATTAAPSLNGAATLGRAGEFHSHATAPRNGAASSAPGYSPETLAQMLVGVVSDRTGYPPEMLELDSNLEADLGIDSIKRVEIIGAFRKGALPALDEPPPWFMEQMAQASTLRAIVDGVTKLCGGEMGNGSAVTIANPKHAAADGEGAPLRPYSTALHDASRLNLLGASVSNVPPQATADPVSAEVVLRADYREECPRCVGVAVEAPWEADDRGRLLGGLVAVTGDGGALAGEVIQALNRLGIGAVLLEPAHFATREAAEATFAALRQAGHRLAGLIHLAPLGDATEFPQIQPAQWQQHVDREVRGLLFLLQGLLPELNASTDGAFRVLAFTRGGDDLVADSAHEVVHPWRAGIAGMLRCAAKEHAGVVYRTVDVEAQATAELVLSELQGRGAVAVGYRNARRWTRVSVRQELPLQRTPDPRTALGPQSVLLVTGGARGITAQIAEELAQRTRATLILLGRSAAPVADEEPTTASLSTRSDLLRVIAAQRRAAGESLKPRDLEAMVSRVLAEREVRETLRNIAAAGSRVEYLPCDVRDSDRLAEVVRGVTARYGAIHGLIHGAGLIEDKFLADKSAASFDRVLGTKLDPVLSLIGLLDPRQLQVVCLFASVSGFFGNPGQVDYAAANEILNAMGSRLSRLWPAKVMSLHWGPWDGTGMVTPEVARQFAQRGIGMVTLRAGRAAAADEILDGAARQTCVICGPGPWVAESTARTTQPGRLAPETPLLFGQQVDRLPDGGVEAVVRFTAADCPFLMDHRIDEQPVLPFAVAMEIMAETVALARPDWHLTQLRGVRMFSGVVFAEPSRELLIRAERLSQDDASGEWRVRMSAPGRPFPPLYEAIVRLEAHAPVPPAMPHLERIATPSPLPTADAYRNWTFHGPSYRAITAITGLDSRGIDSVAQPSCPRQCVHQQVPGHWLIDPILLDVAPQLAMFWGRAAHDTSLLPNRAACFHRYSSFSGGPLELVFRVAPQTTSTEYKADVWFVRDGRVIGYFEGLEGAGSAALNRIAEASRK